MKKLRTTKSFFLLLLFCVVSSASEHQDFSCEHIDCVIDRVINSDSTTNLTLSLNDFSYILNNRFDSLKKNNQSSLFVANFYTIFKTQDTQQTSVDDAMSALDALSRKYDRLIHSSSRLKSSLNGLRTLLFSVVLSREDGRAKIHEWLSRRLNEVGTDSFFTALVQDIHAFSPLFYSLRCSPFGNFIQQSPYIEKTCSDADIYNNDGFTTEDIVSDHGSKGALIDIDGVKTGYSMWLPQTINKTTKIIIYVYGGYETTFSPKDEKPFSFDNDVFITLNLPDLLAGSELKHQEKMPEPLFDSVLLAIANFIDVINNGPESLLIEDQDDILRQKLVPLSAAKIFLMGGSFGGLVVTRFSQRYPDRVAGVISFNGALSDSLFAPHLKSSDFIDGNKQAANFIIFTFNDNNVNPLQSLEYWRKAHQKGVANVTIYPVPTGNLPTYALKRASELEYIGHLYPSQNSLLIQACEDAIINFMDTTPQNESDKAQADMYYSYLKNQSHSKAFTHLYLSPIHNHKKACFYYIKFLNSLRENQTACSPHTIEFKHIFLDVWHYWQNAQAFLHLSSHQEHEAWVISLKSALIDTLLASLNKRRFSFSETDPLSCLETENILINHATYKVVSEINSLPDTYETDEEFETLYTSFIGQMRAAFSDKKIN